jgi:hypothetical protein
MDLPQRRVSECDSVIAGRAIGHVLQKKIPHHMTRPFAPISDGAKLTQIRP